jgi:UDP-N-acetylglucosamine 4-epimerase
LWVKSLINHERPRINGDGTYSRDFTYIDNVIEANEKAMLTPTEYIREHAKEYNIEMLGEHINFVFNVAYGGNTTLNQLYDTLRRNLAQYDAEIGTLEPIYGPNRAGDIPHSQASILKARRLINYDPQYDAARGFAAACEWYWNNLK